MIIDFAKAKEDRLNALTSKQSKIPIFSRIWLEDNKILGQVEGSQKVILIKEV